ncbi:NUDIX domain-containing protein [Nocardiopsis alkaliphila]|uniref:NUDIX domain-containing protein n=1 Tax=Nocardiopsis alkaliphila TaxID=225762 RepID=UPI0003464CDC|nr:NUDIX hydrolase [Nocardiopsis alkaliphila]
MGELSDEEFYASLPATRGAAGALIRSTEGDVLLVRRVYAPDRPWGIPGGIMEADESPLTACLREVTEELGVSASPRRLLVMDWVPPALPRTCALHWLFRVEVSSEEFVLPAEELSGWIWVPPQRLDRYLTGGVARRMITAVRVDDRIGAPIYLENGHPVLPGNI